MSFLAGRDLTILDIVEQKTGSAARNQHFELVARLRDTHDDLSRLSAFLQRLRDARRHSFVYPAAGYDDKENWYLIRHGQVVSVQRKPSDAKSFRRCRQALEAVFACDNGTSAAYLPEDVDVMFLVAR